ncbi:MAG: UDP-N-acetylglucosamine 4,6-dehydratase (inverting) [Elusimicrobia bacterium]|nr:UDP-N-acetylglucosamine 4,6-dehydratase (inverting) [Elusimicrobiota bacterium]MDE2236930.1 UDP-N-acetylglucosamine 4,6-dehydratase (inverting) [Elusimicrobiota bacterium]MDE2425046.1 UDP-N-acetylglucosamine 4,6-dehydratase (inverting) [Elusimicrobiota bacterium]
MKRNRSAIPLSLNREHVAFLAGKSVLVTGGTGSFGKRFVELLLAHSQVKKLVVFSRDELKQSEMAARLRDPRLRFFIGDVRDAQRLQRAFHGIDYVVHAAALKQVPTLEYNPFEAILTNVMGAENVINAAIDQKVERVVALSTDKAVNPINLYGATKLCAEKLFVAGNSYAAATRTHFAVARYGNVIGSRGSVIPLFLKRRKEGVLPLTDERMTRFWLTLEQGIWLVLQALQLMKGGETFVPKLPSMRMTDLRKALAPECKVKIVGIRPGEKLHEVLLAEDEAARAVDLGSLYVVRPNFSFWNGKNPWSGKPAAPSNLRYASDSNDWWMRPAELQAMVAGLDGSSPRTEA